MGNLDTVNLARGSASARRLDGNAGMTCKPRVEFGGAVYHVLIHGYELAVQVTRFHPRYVRLRNHYPQLNVLIRRRTGIVDGIGSPIRSLITSSSAFVFGLAGSNSIMFRAPVSRSFA